MVLLLIFMQLTRDLFAIAKFLFLYNITLHYTATAPLLLTVVLGIEHCIDLDNEH